jgi:hypothetical protein
MTITKGQKTLYVVACIRLVTPALPETPVAHCTAMWPGQHEAVEIFQLYYHLMGRPCLHGTSLTELFCDT